MLASTLFHIVRASVTSGSQHAGGGGVNVDVDLSVLIQFGGFLLLLIIIKPILLDPFLKVVEEREKRTEGAKAEARQMDQQAGEIMKRYETELDKVRRVAGQERERLRTEGQKLEAHVLEQTRTDTLRIASDGKEQIAKQADSIRFDLGKSSTALAGEIVVRVLGRGL